MKLRVIATLVAVLALSVGSASAQSIGVFADLGSSSCNVSVPQYVPTSFYINVVGADALVPAGITGAEFRIIHSLSLADMTITPTPNPASNVTVGDPMGLGVNIAFPSCQVGPSINLYGISVLVFTAFPNSSSDATLGIAAKLPPSNPTFDCPLVTQCDAPVFTSVCVAGGQGFINSTRDCTVAVEESSWSQVKGLYN